ncbi:hypothetical protein [Psychrobacillus sp. FSL H8-0487]|uniref:hypothetical protein n=1 Tax=Psychrobacillus sp. FSL H8-0487 TaxID=2921391 RepID=UPI0030FA5A7C
MILQNINAEEIEDNFVVTEKNYESALYLFLLGFKQSDYNTECFSSREVSRYLAIQEATDYMIQNIIDEGYCPYQLIKSVEEKLEMDLGIYPRPGLKKQIDSHFRIVVNGNIMRFGYMYYRTIKEEYIC